LSYYCPIEILFNTFQSTKQNVSDVPSLIEHLDSWVSYSNLHGPEMPGKLSKGTSSHFGDKVRFGKWKGFSLWPGKASSTSKTKVRLNGHRKIKH
jgi:hypothetical protein